MTRCIVQVPVMYANEEQFQIGKAKILRQAEGDQVSCQQSLFVQLDCSVAAYLLHSFHSRC